MEIRKNIFGDKIFTKYDILILLFPIGFLVSILIYNTYVNNFYKKSIPITKSDSLNLNIRNFYINRGTLIFNKKYVTSYRDLNKETTSFLNEWYELPDSFILKKKKNNDTIFFHFPNYEKYIVLIKKKGSIKTIDDMTIKEIYKKYLKKAKK